VSGTRSISVEYELDGLTLTGRLALPAGEGRCPGVLLGHEGIGLNDFQRERADRLAKHGYAAFAMDYHGRWFSDPAETMAFLEPLLADQQRLRAIGRDALAVLLDQPRVDPERVAAVGYGTGGTIVLELGRQGADLRAIAAVNPVLANPEPASARNLRCPVLICVGSEDRLVTVAQRAAFAAEMQTAGADWRLVIYGGAEHAFHHPPVNPDGSLAEGDTHQIPKLPGVGYHPAHAARAWRAVLDLLDETLR
jgi:dienelactone hydrolase